jgi:hypothetical protein
VESGCGIRSTRHDLGNTMTDPFLLLTARNTDPGPTPHDLLRLIDRRGEASALGAWNGDWNTYAAWLYHIEALSGSGSLPRRTNSLRSSLMKSPEKSGNATSAFLRLCILCCSEPAPVATRQTGGPFGALWLRDVRRPRWRRSSTSSLIESMPPGRACSNRFARKSAWSPRAIEASSTQPVGRCSRR